MLKLLPFVLMAAIALTPACVRPLPVADGIGQGTAQRLDATSYDDYGDLLQAYVSPSGLVDYASLQANPKALNDFVARLGAVAPAAYAGWGETDKMAFLINAYNAITLQSIVEQQPLKPSIRDIAGVWNFKKHSLLGQDLTLDTIEHEMLRKQFSEPRIHSALVCAAISCPPLRQEPFTGDRLDAQLDDQARRWLTSPHGATIDRGQNRVAISSIFKWFGEDWQAQYAAPDRFTGSPKERAALNFISGYLSASDRAYLAQGNYQLTYLDYDWSLNKQ
ncbi:DUF547 domain-containing protein [Nodosilinea nodulosa]|uniref:DUF547 domain-containing protein n=1 Tax=Nodosilinea nodulosa TaxID=416001 RepID=UPI000304EB43|nr:DUF547 domain-containing protein [Nodosilinea nodulosa]